MQGGIQGRIHAVRGRGDSPWLIGEGGWRERIGFAGNKDEKNTRESRGFSLVCGNGVAGTGEGMLKGAFVSVATEASGDPQRWR